VVNSTIGKPIEADSRRWPARVAIAFGEGRICLLAIAQVAREGIAAFKDKRKPQ
jgi:hypothetical protein